MDRGDRKIDLILDRLVALVRQPELPFGTRVYVEETDEYFTGVGSTIQEISNRLNWSQQNAWLPDSALRYIEANHQEFPDPLRAIEIVLQQPDSVHAVPVDATQIRFFMNAERLRVAGLLFSRSIQNVDVLIELRQAPGGTYLRVFHLSPRRHPRGAQLWP